VPIQKLFLLNITGHAQEQPYLITLGKALELIDQFRALLPVILLGEGLAPKAMAANLSVNQANESRVEQ
jgi:hypothetical protein